MNPLLTVRGAITTGFVAAVVLSLLISPTSFGELSLAVAAHRLRRALDRAPLLLQPRADPALAAAAKDKGGPGGAAITRYVAPRALLCSAGRARHLVHGGVVPRPLGKLHRGLHARPRR